MNTFQAVTRTRRAGSQPQLISPCWLFLFLILAFGACKQSHRPPAREVNHRDVAAHLQNVVATAGGFQIWIKHPSRFQSRQSPESSLHVIATPAGYSAVLSALRAEAAKEKLELVNTASSGEGEAHRVNLLVREHGRLVIQVNLREVPRLLRAAIVIDDMGHDPEVAHKLLALDYPLTFSVLPHLRYTAATAEAIHRSGREVMLHLPMEPEPGSHTVPGEGAVLVGMSAEQVRTIVQGDLDSVPYVVGVNNHMGSRATQSAALMADLMRVLKERRLYFIDSRTTAETAALEAARREGLPAFYRAVFLDDTETVPYTLGQLESFRHKVEQEGVALAIGHPHATTVAALARFLPELERADIELVAPSQIVRLPEIARLDPRSRTK